MGLKRIDEIKQIAMIDFLVLTDSLDEVSDDILNLKSKDIDLYELFEVGYQYPSQILDLFQGMEIDTKKTQQFNTNLRLY